MPARLRLAPIRLRAARAWVDAVHRHHAAPQGGLWAHAVVDPDGPVGVAIVGRPVARGLDMGTTVEVTRLACIDAPRAQHACSMLYGAAARAAQAMGYSSIVTYTLGSEAGTSLRAAGWTDEGPAGGGGWSCASRPRATQAPTEVKRRWRRHLADGPPMVREMARGWPVEPEVLQLDLLDSADESRKGAP